MRLSIIVPVYNCESYISKCLDSLVEQDLSYIEIIVVNDGSTDKSLSIINNYARKYKFITVIDQKNAGQGKARNEALEICKGEYITFVDSDDFMSGKDNFSVLYNQCKNNNLDMLVYNYNIISGGKILNKKLVLDTSRLFSRKEILKKFLITNEVEGFSCNKLFKKEILLKNNIMFLEGKKFEDIPMVVNCILKSERFMFNNGKFYNYVIHKNSTTNNVKLATLLDEIDSMELVVNLILKNNYDSDVRLFISKYISCRVCLYISYRIRNLLKRKLSYFEFKVVMNNYCRIINDLNKKYGLKFEYTRFVDKLKFKVINLLYGR